VKEYGVVKYHYTFFDLLLNLIILNMPIVN